MNNKIVCPLCNGEFKPETSNSAFCKHCTDDMDKAEQIPAPAPAPGKSKKYELTFTGDKGLNEYFVSGNYNTEFLGMIFSDIAARLLEKSPELLNSILSEVCNITIEDIRIYQLAGLQAAYVKLLTEELHELSKLSARFFNYTSPRIEAGAMLRNGIDKIIHDMIKDEEAKL